MDEEKPDKLLIAMWIIVALIVMVGLPLFIGGV